MVSPAETTNTVLRALWPRVKPRDLARDERLELDAWSGAPALRISDTTDAYLVRADYFRVDRRGDMIRSSYVSRAVELPYGRIERLMRMSDAGALIDYVREELRYLAITLRPTRKPRGYRLLSRRLVLATRAKPRRRLA